MGGFIVRELVYQLLSIPFSIMRRLLRISRPRFWMYVFGPYIVGALCGSETPNQFFSPLSLVFAFFFLFPANLLIYGINDVFDYETDVLNVKKQGYEDLVPPDERAKINWATTLFCGPFLFLLPLVPVHCLWAMAAFLFFSIFYSAPPIRAKAKPILDSAFNVLYIFPGVFAYFLVGGIHFSWPLFLGAWAWAMAMHAYSAVPDISADKGAGVATVATFLGFNGTLVFCLLLYILSGLVALPALRWLALLLTLLYVVLMTVSIRSRSEAGVMSIYRYFPLTNTLAGGAIFWFMLWGKSAFWPKF